MSVSWLYTHTHTREVRVKTITTIAATRRSTNKHSVYNYELTNQLERSPTHPPPIHQPIRGEQTAESRETGIEGEKRGRKYGTKEGDECQRLTRQKRPRMRPDCMECSGDNQEKS